uniref:Uncharacterized protein n=1 Tax=Rhizophora mucronata TaxID=61149 RepID=A0A2P2KJ99_RHIMU
MVQEKKRKYRTHFELEFYHSFSLLPTQQIIQEKKRGGEETERRGRKGKWVSDHFGPNA